MLDDPRFLPVLQPAAWAARGRCWCRPLAPTRGAPLVAFGLVAARSAWLTAELAAGEDLGAVEAAALAHLRDRGDRPAWMPTRLEGGAAGCLRDGDVHTASDVLDPRVLHEAAELLGDARFAVALPQRALLIASRDVAALAAAARRLHEEAGAEAALSPDLLHVEDGRIVGIAADASAAARHEPPRRRAVDPGTMGSAAEVPIRRAERPQQADAARADGVAIEVPVRRESPEPRMPRDEPPPRGGDESGTMGMSFSAPPPPRRQLPAGPALVRGADGAGVLLVPLHARSAGHLAEEVAAWLDENAGGLRSVQGFDGTLLFVVDNGDLPRSRDAEQVAEELAARCAVLIARAGLTAANGDPVQVAIRWADQI